jgi:hypothetical protein
MGSCKFLALPTIARMDPDLLLAREAAHENVSFFPYKIPPPKPVHVLLKVMPSREMG